MTRQRTIDMVVIFLGTLGVVALVAATFLAWNKLAIPDQLWTVVGGVVVGLPSLLASTRTTEAAAQDVQVVNAPADPVPVAPAPPAPVAAPPAPDPDPSPVPA